MTADVHKPLQGKILVSEPFMNDFYFKRSIILLADHSIEGSFGLILNKPTNIKLSAILTGQNNTSGIPSKFNNFVWLGGPVKTDSLFFIHTRGDLIDESYQISEGVFWGGNVDLIRQLMEKDQIDPGEIRYFVGYSGWAPKQLDNELKQNSWVVASTDIKSLLSKKPGDMWKNMVKSLGKSYADWINYPIDPQMN